MSDSNNQRIRDIVKSASTVYIGLFLELIIAFAAQVLAARHLSVSGFGGLTTGTALLDIGAIVGGLGLAAGLTRYLPRIGDAEKRTLTAVTIGITAVVSVVCGAFVVLNARFIATSVFGEPSVAVSLQIFGAAIPFSALLSVAIGGIRGQKESLYQVFVKNIVHPIARFALVFVAVLYGLGQAAIASAYALPYVLSAVLALVLLHRTLPKTWGSVDRGLVESVTRYSLPFTISNISGFVYRSIDIFLILFIMSSTDVGIYGVAYAAVSFMGMFSTAFNYLASPIASEFDQAGDPEELLSLFGAVTRWLVVLSICGLIPLGVFATEFITVIYSSQYASGGTALTILAVGFAVKNVLSIHNSILEGLGRSKLLSYNSIAAALVNVLLNLVLIPVYGIVGAAVATGLSFVLRDGLAVYQVRSSIGSVPVSRNSAGLVAVGIPLFAVLGTVVDPVVPTTLPWLIVVTGAFATLYVSTVVVLFGLTDTEVMVVRSAAERYGLELGPLDALLTRLSN